MDDSIGVAIVTGAANGIGKAIAERLTADGFRVVVADIDGEAAEKTASDLDGAVGVQHDVRDSAAARRVVELALERFGRIDVLVNNAGTNIHSHPTVDVTEADFDLVMGINVKGTFLTIQAVIPTMQAQGGGRIVNMSSILGLRPVATVATYCASKYAVTGLSESLAAELAPHGITVNTVHPGSVETALHEKVVAGFSARQGISLEETSEMARKEIPLGRYQTVEDVAALVAFIVSPAAKDITGSAFKIDGGVGLG